LTVAFDDLGDRYSIGNDDGWFVIWKQITTDANGLIVGPGYIGRVIFRSDGKKLVEGFTDDTLALNDTRQQGLGLVGWHHHRRVPNETNIWNKSWNMDVHRDADGPTRGGYGVSASRVVVPPYVNASGECRCSFEVDLVDPWTSAEGKRISLIRYDYIVDSSQVKCWVTWTQQPDGADSGPPVFVKEPKITFSMCPPDGNGARLRYFDLFTDTGAALVSGLDMNTIGDPSKHTQQLGYDKRCRARFYEAGEGWYFNIVGRANGAPVYGSDGKPSSYGSRTNWEGAGYGMDQWAVNANSRAHFDDSVCPAYCLQGPLDAGGNKTLTRQWELVKDPTLTQCEFHMHAWEGGYGTPDCLCCARAFKPGEKWATYLSMSKDAGWTI
jgi:hypothetical protein